LRILFSKKAEKYLFSLPKRTALNLLDRIQRIPEGDIKPLAGRKGEYRLRFSSFRVLFFIEEGDVRVFKIDTRGDVYK
jgi:mRNA interferase RelE/StbE